MNFCHAIDTSDRYNHMINLKFMELFNVTSYVYDVLYNCYIYKIKMNTNYYKQNNVHVAVDRYISYISVDKRDK